MFRWSCLEIIVWLFICTIVSWIIFTITFYIVEYLIIKIN
jgi:hypothetical protein